MEGVVLPKVLTSSPFGDVTATAGPDLVAVAATDPADEGLAYEQSARARMVARVRTAHVILMRSPG